jgi:hypothetical protein
MQLSGYSLVRLRDNGEFILYRAYPTQTELSSVLLLVPFATHPSPETLKKIDHEYSLRRELNSAWAVRPLALSERDGQTTLVFEDPGGETLDGFLSGADADDTIFRPRCRSRNGTRRVARKEVDSQGCKA